MTFGVSLVQKRATGFSPEAIASAVGARDEGPGDAECARIAREWPVGKF
jgi:hypothetical protein